MRVGLAANRKHLSPASAQSSAEEMPTDSSGIAGPNSSAVPSNLRKRMSWGSIKRNDSTGNDQSLKSLINAAGLGNVSGFSGSLPSSNENQLDQIIPNFVSKQVRRVCYQMCAEVALKAESGSQELLTSPKLSPTATEAFAAVVMVDVSGYSKLTAVLAERGPVGAELLTKTMKGYLDKIIQTIVTHGGDIVKFAGDAVIFCWKSEKATNVTDASQDKIRGELVYKASHCCLTLLTKLGTYDIDIEDCPTKTLRIHLGIGSGLIYDVLVGGDPGRWEHFIAGDGVNQLSQVLDLAKAGELALSHQALKWLSCVIDIATVNLGDYDKRCIILTGLEKAQRKGHAPPDIEDEIIFKDTRQMEANVELYRNFVDRTALFKLQADINQSRLFLMEAGLMELLNLTELRQVTTIFIKVGSLQTVHRNDILDESQRAITIVQTALHRCEGSLRQFHVDDKGAVILCFFGLPPLAHENDAGLGIKAGLEIRDRFLDIFDDFSIGITTGVVSYGGVGAPGRAEYAVMGDSINMAARLMCHAEAAEGILCDEKTYNLCESDFIFDNLGETKVKGKNTAISIFRPNGPVPEATKNKSKSVKTSDGLNVIGREKERKSMTDALDRMNVEDMTDAIIIEADGGQGLSTLIAFAKNESLKRQCHISISDNAELEKTTPYYAWQTIIHDLVSFIENGSNDDSGMFVVPPPMASNPNLNPDKLSQCTPSSPINNTAPIQLDTVSPGTTVGSPGSSSEVSPRKTPQSDNADGPSSPENRRVSATSTPASANLSPIAQNSSVSRLKTPKLSLLTEGKETNEFEPTSPKVITPVTAGGSGMLNTANLPATSGVAPSPSTAHPPARGRRMSIMKVDSDEYLADSSSKSPNVTGSLSRSRHPTPMPPPQESPEEVEAGSSTFQSRIAAALEKISEDPEDAMLFDLIFPPPDQNTDGEIQNVLGVRVRELMNLVSRIIGTLTHHNKMLLMINEAQWMDTTSWELLYEVLTTCPRVVVFVFTRPEASYENKDNRTLLRRIQNLTRTKRLMVGGLSMEETRQLIIASWTGHSINNVSPKIVESIYKRTDGNPFFIRSLTVAMKNSGQWRLSPDGALTTQNGDFDFEQLVLGYDNQSIILAQFDRVDRNFQLFLKVAAVLGQRFLLDDVLYFLTGMSGASEQMDRKNYSQIIRAVQNTDKYGFLQKENATSDGVFFHFKSAVVRKCIYSMMVHKQRQRLHEHVAVYYESRLNDSNRHKYLILIFEHFMEADASQTRKKLHYLEMVASYNYERGAMSECIRYYKQLLEIAGIFRKDLPQGTDFKKSTVANWYRELGHALFLKEELSEAEKNLLEALRMYGEPLPDKNFKIQWEIQKQLRICKRREANFFQHFEQARRDGENGSGYKQSYRPPKSLSSYSLNNVVNMTSKRLEPTSGAQSGQTTGIINGNLLAVGSSQAGGGSSSAHNANNSNNGPISINATSSIGYGTSGASASANSSANAIVISSLVPVSMSNNSPVPSSNAANQGTNLHAPTQAGGSEGDSSNTGSVGVGHAGNITSSTSNALNINNSNNISSMAMHSQFSQNIQYSSKQANKDRNASQSLVRETGSVRQSPVQGVQHVLIILAELYSRTYDFQRHQLCVLMGLNMSQGTIQENMLARFFSFGSVMLWTAKIRPHMAILYLDAADKLDSRAEISTSIQIVNNQSTLLFMMGKWENAIKSIESLCYLSTIAGDSATWVRGMVKRAFIQFCGISRTATTSTVKELLNISIQKESSYGKFCAYLFSLFVLLSSEGDNREQLREILTKFEEYSPFKSELQVKSVMFTSAYVGMRTLVRAYLDGTFNLQEDLEPFLNIMSNLKNHQWNVMSGATAVALVLFMALERGALDEPKTRKFVENLCAKTNAAFKKVKVVSYAGSVRRVFKGLRLLLQQKRDKAVKAWNKGFDATSEVELIQAILNFAIGKYGNSSTLSQEAADRAKNAMTTLQVQPLFKNIWGSI